MTAYKGQQFSQSAVSAQTAPGISSTAVRLLWLALVGTAALLGSEIVHYLRVTDLAATDQLPQVFANVHPQCVERGSHRDLRCPFPGYNSVTVICWDFQCVYGDPNLPVTTEARRLEHIRLMRNAELASLAVEEPFSAASPQWQKRASDLRRNSSASDMPHLLPTDRPPETIPDAQIVIQERADEVSRKVAQDWLEQHAR